MSSTTDTCGTVPKCPDLLCCQFILAQWPVLLAPQATLLKHFNHYMFNNEQKEGVTSGRSSLQVPRIVRAPSQRARPVKRCGRVVTLIFALALDSFGIPRLLYLLRYSVYPSSATGADGRLQHAALREEVDALSPRDPLPA